MNDNFKATKAEFEEWAKEFPSLLEPKATNRKIKECVITIFLENEDSQKFNLWLNDCFHELNEYYALDAINSGIVYRFPNLYTNGLKDTSAVISPLYDNQSRMGKPIFIKWIELGARLELGIRLKVMITFPFDPRIRNPLLSILYCLYNDFTDSRAAIFEALQGVKNTFQLDDSILPSPAPTVDAVGTESKSPKDKAGTAQINEPPKKKPRYVPRRGSKKFGEWCDRWDKVKSRWITRRESLKSINEYLLANYPDLACPGENLDTLEDTVLAGENGDLDPLKIT